MQEAEPGADGVPATVRAAALGAFALRDDAVLLDAVDPADEPVDSRTWVDPSGRVRVLLHRDPAGTAVLRVSVAVDEAPLLQALGGPGLTFLAAAENCWTLPGLPEGPVSVLLTVGGARHRTAWGRL